MGIKKKYFLVSIVLLLIGIGLPVAVIINNYFISVYSFEELLQPILIMLGGVIFLTYLLLVVKSIKLCIPFIVCSSWLVYIEPAPVDIFAIVAIAILVLKSILTKSARIKVEIIDLFLIAYLIFSLQIIFNSTDETYSITYYLINAYLIAFTIFISRITQSIDFATSQLWLFCVPGVITAVALLAAFVSLNYGVSLGFLNDVLIMEGSRAKAFFKDPNVAGPFLLIPISWLLSIKNFHAKIKARYFYPLLFILASGVIATYSRAAILGLITVFWFIYLFEVNLKSLIKKIPIVIIFLIFLAIVYTMMSDIDVASRIFDPSEGTSGRLERIVYGIDKFVRSPFFGVGMDYDLDFSPHDSYIIILTQSGVIGFLLLWTPIFMTIKKNITAARKTDSRETKTILVALSAILFSHVIIGTVIYILHWRHLWYIFGLALYGIRSIKKNY